MSESHPLDPKTMQEIRERLAAAREVIARGPRVVNKAHPHTDTAILHAALVDVDGIAASLLDAFDALSKRLAVEFTEDDAALAWLSFEAFMKGAEDLSDEDAKLASELRSLAIRLDALTTGVTPYGRCNDCRQPIEANGSFTHCRRCVLLRDAQHERDEARRAVDALSKERDALKEELRARSESRAAIEGRMETQILNTNARNGELERQLRSDANVISAWKVVAATRGDQKTAAEMRAWEMKIHGILGEEGAPFKRLEMIMRERDDAQRKLDAMSPSPTEGAR